MRDTTSEREYDSRFDPAFQPGFEPADDDFAGLFAAPGPDEAPELAVAEVRRRLVDRFVVVLWVVGGVLAVGGGALLVNSMGGFLRADSSSSFTFEYQMLVMLYQLSPYLITVGLATLVGTLFLLAVRWERRS
ncbi:hypothetical protein VD659_18660 [Herbiconiux sp. 11R-BC]|uniref:hypothetical protein n=1 Tax=Herbiconiux sp. 11R-BC TaxID=3111637 RepID=UPI003C0D7230